MMIAANSRTANLVPNGIGPIAMKDVEIESVMIRQMPHTANEGVFQGAVIGPLGEDFVDGGIVDFGLVVSVFGHG
jgi:hypothetical protein